MTTKKTRNEYFFELRDKALLQSINVNVYYKQFFEQKIVGK